MKVIFVQLFIFLLTSRSSKSDWVSEWMSPIEDQLVADRFNGDSMMVHMSKDEETNRKTTAEPQISNQMSAINLKIKLDQTMRTAKVLAQTLKAQIRDLIVRETMLKETIANGRLGVSILSVSTMNQPSRSYIIRDGRWTTCNGQLQYPVTSQTSGTSLFNGLFSVPRCIGKEIVLKTHDPCVFNSVIKYDVIPTTRAPEYTEEEYLCLKPNFNITLERYMSVTRQTINETCENGAVKSLADNTLECGVRILSEYSFYPYKSSAASTLPLEYCIENDGSCKLIVAWHVSNATIENFEFLKNEHNFKKYFIKSGPYLEHVI